MVTWLNLVMLPKLQIPDCHLVISSAGPWSTAISFLPVCCRWFYIFGKHGQSLPKRALLARQQGARVSDLAVAHASRKTEQPELEVCASHKLGRSRKASQKSGVAQGTKFAELSKCIAEILPPSSSSALGSK